MHRRPDRTPPASRTCSAGFTIIELAIALFLTALLFGGISVPLATQIDTRNTERTERLLADAREALMSYAVTHGHFPCPADATSAGLEPRSADHMTGQCPTYYGFLPAATLGLREALGSGLAVDAWGGPGLIRYAVSPQTIGPATNTNTLTRAQGMRAAGIPSLSDPALSLLHVCDSAKGVSGANSCGSAGTIVSTAPVMVWSAGPNAAVGGTSADEAQNPNPNGGSLDRIFVSHSRSTVPGKEFDDVVTWVPMPVLVGRMVAAGRLP
jgi:type II secretory pathway pseudopilin PulG